MAYVAPGAWSTKETVAVGKLNVLINDIPALQARLTQKNDKDTDQANTWSPANASGDWEGDSSGLISQVMPEQVSDLIFIAKATWYDEAAYPTSMAFRASNTTDGANGDTTGMGGSGNASCRQGMLVLGLFENVTAAAKTVRLQGSRESTGRTIRVTGRRIAAISWSST